MGCEESKPEVYQEKMKSPEKKSAPSMKKSKSVKQDAHMNRTIKLWYFKDYRGRVEPVRLLLAFGGVKYENVGVKQEDWPGLKPTTPYGSLPILEINGHKLIQSIAIGRYVASECGALGSTTEEQAKSDMLVHTIEDFRDVFFGVRFSMRTGTLDDEDEREKLLDDCDKAWDKLLSFIERYSKSGEFLAGSKPTLSDFWLYSSMENAQDSVIPDIWSRSPLLAAWKRKFESIPAIKRYIDSRPTNYLA